MKGSDALLALTAAGNAVRAFGSSFGSAFTESARSLFAPGRFTTLRRSVNTGTERCSTGCSLRRNGSRLRVATFEVLVGGVQRGRDVIVGLVRLRALAYVGLGEALDQQPQRLARRAVEGVEELVEVDGRGRVCPGQRRVLGNLGRVVGAGRDRDVV